ncbi:MAG TPA: hypothetical protein VD996_15070 [Chitinophagaceae bacterium]|nr:hypothetical protein [Chitinophagaceae bacterium]
MNLRNLIVTLILLAQTVYCWVAFYRAQFLAYDDNYGTIIHAFVISLFTLLALIVVLAVRTQWIKSNKILIILWLIMGSPITFFVASVLYENIFGGKLSN